MEKLHLGVARELITPPLGVPLYGYRPSAIAARVEDDLTATAFYFKQGSVEALMISVTVCLLNTALVARLRSLIEEKFGIPGQLCMVSATHTHSGPNTNGQLGWGEMDSEYIEGTFLKNILKAVEKAKENPTPVTVGSATGKSEIGINRRELTADNVIRLGQNPWGCFDPRMTVLSFKNEEGAVVANMVHYGCHGTCAGRNTEITRDWSGIMTDALERQSGAITAFFNGPEGDVGPRLSNGKTVDYVGEGIRYVREIGHKAAQDAVRIYKEIYDYRAVDLVSECAQIFVPVKPRISLEEAKAIYEENKDVTTGVQGSFRAYGLSVMNAYEAGAPEVECLQFEQSVIALGNLVFVSFPYELFSEIALRIDGCFHDKRILSLSNTNGSEGYFITEDAICRGGYEVVMFTTGQVQPYCDHADFALMQNTVHHIKNVFNKEE